MRNLQCSVRYSAITALLLGGWAALGAAGTGGDSIPVPTLYRILFRHMNSLEATADDLDGKKQSGGDELRGHFQKELNLSDPEAAVLKSAASDCGRKLDAQEGRALAAIQAAKAKDVPGAPGKAPVPSVSTKAMLAALEQERLDISTGCVASLQSGVSSQTAAAVDMYVRTVIAGKTVVKPPVIAVPTEPLSKMQKGGHD